VIPLRLKISGFLSYRESAELDFTGFDLACISGPNGAGKSTLLDAITWALFGQARRRDDALINLQSDTADVAFSFRYESTDYRILRSLRRGKSGSLELQARLVADNTSGATAEASWKPLTERTQRETQARIEEILRLDYETFINASFFLQGKADLFAQQTPSRRKEVLGSILGMEVWEQYKARTAERRRRSEADLTAAMARIGEVGAELAEEPQRRQRLAELEAGLDQLVTTRKSQTSVVENLRQSRALMEKQRALLTEQTSALEGLARDVDNLESRLRNRGAAQRETAELTAHADQIEADYAAWRESINELESWEGIARAFREHEKRRAPMLQEIAADQARLEQEKRQLENRGSQVEQLRRSVERLEQELRESEAAASDAALRVRERNALRAQLAAEREDLAGKIAENGNLKEKMEDLKRRIETLDAALGATCPLCGQELTNQHRISTVEKLQSEGRELGNRYRANSAAMQALHESTEEAEVRLTNTASLEADEMSLSRAVAALMERRDTMRGDIADWQGDGQEQLAEVVRKLAMGDYATASRKKLAAVDARLAALGYDAAAHDEVRRREAALRSSEQAHSRLQSARGALEPLENEILSLQAQLTDRQNTLGRLSAQVAEARQVFDVLAAGTPDLVEAETQLFDLQEQENRLNQEVGAARQKVNVLADLKARDLELQARRQTLALLIGRHKMLEAAFGKDGVPALLIEQALPELEAHANDILDRLSDGRMSVHFETQAAYRDRKRDDLRETLDIRISDGAGQRSYEMYSGGEAFRVNFAIRLALSQVLAGRTGARLQTLVIDEGFGSQDSQGVQRLIETINVIRPGFAKILLISHLEELKDAFPTRIEVEKGERGSVLRVN
jgi:exonuclease SbcC